MSLLQRPPSSHNHCQSCDLRYLTMLSWDAEKQQLLRSATFLLGNLARRSWWTVGRLWSTKLGTKTLQHEGKWSFKYRASAVTVYRLVFFSTLSLPKGATSVLPQGSGRVSYRQDKYLARVSKKK